VVNATPRPLYSRERPGTHCTGGSVGPRAGLDERGKSRPPPGFDPRNFQPVASRYTEWNGWVLVGRPDGNRPLGRPRRRWVDDNIKDDIQEVGWGNMEWIGLAQGGDRWRALVKALMNLWVP